MPGNFLDTNVLLYLLSSDWAKADRAEQLMHEGGTINVQVLNEIANAARRKMGIAWPKIFAFLELVRELMTVRPVTLEIHQTGLALAERHRFAIYDSMIVAAALHADCQTLWSEDMQHGMMVGTRLRIANPFRA